MNAFHDANVQAAGPSYRTGYFLFLKDVSGRKKSVRDK